MDLLLHVQAHLIPSCKEDTAQKITHLYLHFSQDKKNQNATWGGNMIKLLYLSSLEERWMSGLPWCSKGPWPPQGFVSLSRTVLSGSLEGLQIGSCWRKIDREGYKWPSSNCLTETQHIRPTGLHNLGLIYLPRDVCNPIPLYIHLHLHLNPPITTLQPTISCHFFTPLKLNLRPNSRPVWTPRLKAWDFLALAQMLGSLEPMVKVMGMYIIS